DAVSVLRDLESGPMKIGQGGDEAGNDAGFANAAGVSADDEDRHGSAFGFWLLAFTLRRGEPRLYGIFYFDAQRSFLADRDRNANSLRYSRMGRAGVPQKTTPLPRITFLVGMPLCAPRIAPASIRT